MTIMSTWPRSVHPPWAYLSFRGYGNSEGETRGDLGAYSKYLLTMMVVLALIPVFPQIITFPPQLVMGLR